MRSRKIGRIRVSCVCLNIKELQGEMFGQNATEGDVLRRRGSATPPYIKNMLMKKY